MIPRKVVTTLFLAFTAVIAFYNLLLGRPQYAPFVLPFAVAAILSNKTGMVFEALGVLAVAVYLMAAQALYIGIMGMVIAAVLFFTLGARRGIVHAYIYGTSVIVGLCAYLNPYGYPSPSLEVLLTATIYFVSVFAVHIALDNYIAEIKNAKPLDHKCLDALEKASRTAHDAIDLAKERGHCG